MGGDQRSWPYLFAMLGVTLGGIFVISTLISILTTGLESRIENLRKGRSRVIERGHTVILGWSDQVYPIHLGAGDRQCQPTALMYRHSG